MCERSENEVVPISRLFNCSAEFELPKIWIRKRTFAMWLRFRIASHKITPVYGRSFNNTAALNGRQVNECSRSKGDYRDIIFISKKIN